VVWISEVANTGVVVNVMNTVCSKQKTLTITLEIAIRDFFVILTFVPLG